MTSVERAGKFIQARGRAIALTIVPLATLTLAATQHAKADPLTFNNDGTCQVTVSGFAGAHTCSDTIIDGLQNGATDSIKVQGSGTVLHQNTQELEGFSTIANSITFEASGTASGTDFQPLPFNWDFLISDSRSSVTTVSYTLTYSFNNGGVATTESGPIALTACGDISGCGTVTGNDSLNFNGTSVTNYDIKLIVTANLSGNDSLTVTIPSNSIDVNLQSGAPEPTTWALGGTGLLALMLSRFRRRKV